MAGRKSMLASIGIENFEPMPLFLKSRFAVGRDLSAEELTGSFQAAIMSVVFEALGWGYPA